MALVVAISGCALGAAGPLTTNVASSSTNAGATGATTAANTAEATGGATATPGAGASYAYAAGTPEEAGASFTVGGLTYQVLTAATDGATGTVQLTEVDRSTQGALDIPSSVTSPNSGESFTVSHLQFNAFTNCSLITQVSIPASITSYQFCNNRLSSNVNSCFIGCTSLSAVTVDEQSPCFAAEDGVLYAVNSAGAKVGLLAFPQAKADVASFTVPAEVSTVLGNAFAGNTTVASVTFQGSLAGDAIAYTSTANTGQASSFAGGIGGAAFKGCTALKSVSFPEGATLGTNVNSATPALGSYAFQDCTALESITIPVIQSADRKADSYHSFEDYNPASNLTSGITSPFTSGFASYWHNQDGPVARPGIGSGTFSGCSSLATVVFAAGGNNGAYAYWAGSSALFTGCSNLQALIFEGTQAYWGNTQTSMQNGATVDIWTDSDGNVIANPRYYLAVDYYATQAAADAADDAGSTRLARIEFERGTSTASIAASDASLAGTTAPREAYATREADGAIPDPNEAATAAGLGEGPWVWKLSDTQSHRAGLTESCRAYLARVNDISAGRLDAPEVTALYLACDRNLSQSVVADTAFDPVRYESDSTYRINGLSGEDSPVFSFSRITGQLVDGFAVRAADGTELAEGSYAVSYSRYDSASGSFADAQLGDGSGAYLATITPTAESGYTGTLQEWVVVASLRGSVSQRYSDTPQGTAQAARYPYSQTTSLSFGETPYAVSVGANDAIGALVASGYAGLVQGAVNVSASDSTTFGFQIDSSIYNSGEVRDESYSTSFTRANGSGDAVTEMLPADYANSCFDAFARRRSSLGASTSAYPWGSTAALVPATHASTLASASAWAYANKAPIFFTEVDGSVSDATLAHLKQFANVKVMGDESQISADAYAALAEALAGQASVSRLAGSDASSGAFSRAVAQDLVSAGLASWKNVSISDGENPVDCIAALTFTGHELGITLQVKSTADAKQALQLLHDNAGMVEVVALYGRNTDNTTALASSAWSGNAFGALWEDDASFAAALAGITSTLSKYPDVDDRFDTGADDPGDGDDGKKDDGGDNGGSNNGGNGGDNGTATTPKASSNGGTSNTPATGNTPTGSSGKKNTGSNPNTTKKPSAGAAAGSLNNNATAMGDAEPPLVNPDYANETMGLDASGANTETAAVNAATTSNKAPLSARLAFMGALVIISAGAVPILRRCK